MESAARGRLNHWWCGDRDSPLKKILARRLPAVPDLLGEPRQVAHGPPRAVIADHPARKIAKDLVLLGLDDTRVDLGPSVDRRREIHLEAPVIAREAPRTAVGSTVRHVKGDFVKLVRAAVDEQHILARRRCIAKA